MAFLLVILPQMPGGWGWVTEEVGPVSAVNPHSLLSDQTHSPHRRTHPLSGPVTPSFLVLPARAVGPMAGHVIVCGRQCLHWASLASAFTGGLVLTNACHVCTPPWSGHAHP